MTDAMLCVLIHSSTEAQPEMENDTLVQQFCKHVSEYALMGFISPHV